jgi:cytochrome c556
MQATKPRQESATKARKQGDRRRIFAACLAVVMVLGGSFTALAQEKAQRYPIFNAEHLDEAMKTVGLAFTLARSAIDKNSPENAKDYLIRARDQLATTITFWRDRKNDDAIATLRETLKKMDALDAAMSTDNVDIKAASTLAASVNTSCEACHAKYREQDPATKAYRVKPDAH